MGDKLQDGEGDAEGVLRALGRRGRPKKHKQVLSRDHPTAAAFLDESGAISIDRFFAVGCLIIEEPMPLLRGMQALRDKHHWYTEIHWSELTRGTMPIYRELVQLILDSGARFSCFIADRQVADPVDRFEQNQWLAYEKLATQVLVASIRPYELVSVVADNYSTPPEVRFEQDVRAAVNGRLGRLAAVTVCRHDSKACDPLQAVDVLTGAVTFEFRQHAGLAGTTSPKAVLAEEVRNAFGASSVLGGVKAGDLSVQVYDPAEKKKKSA